MDIRARLLQRFDIFANCGSLEGKNAGRSEAATLQRRHSRLNAPGNTDNPVQADFTNEIRFAVVMYGGVSLCVYMNGIAQELLELSRATAADKAKLLLHKPVGAGSVYRRIAKYLGSEPWDAALLASDATGQVRTRFVVDVLSGTSAGGLNSLFLSKALANDQDMQGLQELWLQEGDISRLLNDNESVRGEDCLDKPVEPASLLNSQRMYKKLLVALDAMDFPSPSSAAANLEDLQPAGRSPSPHVQELDCFITATDLSGLPMEMKLANTVATEERHRSVFHFRYAAAENRNDFEAKHNPFLAFTGRCTSAFPFAFEPMRLADIEPILPFWTRYNPNSKARAELRRYWETFFYSDYAQSGDDFAHRSFGDGGYLDNKPFSYATRSLMRRRGTLPVKRKLIYIDPSPERVRSKPSGEDKPDFIQNCIAAVLDLPRYETIREDIQVVIERNKLLDTVSALTAPVDEDVERLHELRLKAAAKQASPKNQPPQSVKTYQETGLSERMETDGVGYGTYHRLRVRGVTSKIASLISRASHFNPESEECQPIRWIIEKWVEEMFAEDPDQGAKVFAANGDHFSKKNGGRPRSAQASFLASFDIEYRMRRIFFLQRRIGDLLRIEPSRVSESVDPSRVRPDCPDWLGQVISDAGQLALFRAELRAIKQGLDEPLSILIGVERAALKSEQIGPMLRQVLSKVENGQVVAPSTVEEARAWLGEILEQPDRVEKIYKDNRENVDAIARYIATLFDNEFRRARECLTKILPWGAPDSKPLEHEKLNGKMAAHAALQRIARQFDYYDAVIFPIQYGTDSGEANRVDIVRISPPDAQQLINETSTTRRKLAGTALFSFGAFLARFWRENDMLWGRLDAAEVLVKTLLQGTPVGNDFKSVTGLVNEAHRAILSEALTLKQREQLWDFICEAFAGSSHARGNKPPSEKEIRSAVQDVLRELPDLDQRLRTVLRFAGVEKDEELREYFATKYEVRRQLAATEQLQLTARAGRIVSRMLNVVARGRGYTALQKHTALLPRVAAVVWGLVEVSIPRTVGWVLWDDWRHRLYSWGVILAIAGLFWQPLVVAGVCILAATLFIDTVRWWIGDLVRAKGRLRSLFTWVVTAVVVVLLFFCVVGAITSWKAIHSKIVPATPVRASN